jgi:hypothetical protein
MNSARTGNVGWKNLDTKLATKLYAATSKLLIINLLVTIYDACHLPHLSRH